MKKTRALAAIVAFNILLPLNVMAVEAHHSADAKASQSTAQMSDGEVRKIDKEAGKVTIKHGPIENLGMPPMTMAYRVKDQAMLDQVKTGDKIKFTAEKAGGAFTVTRIETAK